MSVQDVESLLKSDDQGRPGELPTFAWPGGYTMFYLTGDGSELCAKCATEILKRYKSGESCYSGEVPMAYGAYGVTQDFSDYVVRCDNCNKVICEAEE
jgi:hypothetical protein